MGILNVTPDSFSDGGAWRKPAQAIRRAEQMAAEGAAVIDVGGESTRPGAPAVDAREERRRVVPVVTALAKRLRVPISVDTSKAVVARAALDAGASMMNDVTALRGDPEMAAVFAQARVPVVLMHMRGTPRTMQRRPRYRNVVDQVRQFLAAAIRTAERQGIASSRIWIDPGLGFGKTVAHNLILMKELDRFVKLGHPVVIGPSRKSFIGRILKTDVGERLAGTLACVAQAMAQGVQIVRVHDVKPAAQLIAMWDAIQRA